MEYIKESNNQKYIENMIVFLMDQAMKYKGNNPKMYDGYIILAHDLLKKLKKESDANE